MAAEGGKSYASAMQGEISYWKSSQRLEFGGKKNMCLRQSLVNNLLNQVKIVMGLEEEFGITVEEANAQSITAVQDAADLMEKLSSEKGA